jgi:putative transposase
VLERQFNRSFAEHLPKALRKCTSRLAIDVVLLPYHGQPHQRLEEIYRSQAKSGTTHFHAYATCYVVHKGRRFTVALMRVEQGTSMVMVLKQLLRTARNTGVRLRLLLLDRSFYSVEVIRYLQAARYPFLMPVICRGRKPSDPRGPSSTYVFAAQKHAGWASYMLRHDTHQTVTVRLYPLSQLAGTPRSTGTSELGLCLLGHNAEDNGLGLSDLPLALWH